MTTIEAIEGNDAIASSGCGTRIVRFWSNE